MTTTKSKPKSIDSIDFMMMDVHRQLDEEELPEGTAIDKTVHAEEIVERCETCFGPMPCEDHKKVEHINVVTLEDIDPTNILAKAHNAGLIEVVVVGMRSDGTEYFASSVSDGAASMYHLQRGIYKLNKAIDGEYEDENVCPKPA